MATGGYKMIRQLGMAAVLGAFALFTGCAAYARSTTVVRSPAPEAEDRQADEFIGTPIMGDYDNEEDLDFVLEVKDGDKVFKLEVHESAGGGNRALLEDIRQRVNALEDTGSIRVIGYYNAEYRGSVKEYGFLDLKMIAFFDEETGKEEAFFTDPQDSPFYTQSDVTVIYAPGHHYSTIRYPRYVSPWWDNDGDGIPNRYDPWPYSYDTWYDYNMNYIPDWYDPYYVGYYSYWDYWHVDFWAGYNWYSPRYYRHGWNTAGYYNDYRTYTRLYDTRYVNNRDNSNRRHLRLDAKSEHIWRNAYERDRSNTTRVAKSTPGTRSYRGYESRPVDNRVLVDASTRSRSATDSRDRVVASTGGRDYTGGSDTFTRNRVTSGNPADNTRTRNLDVTRVAGTDKSKTSRAVNTNTRTRTDRASVSSRAASTSVRGSEGRSAAASTRSRNVSSGRTTTSSSNRVYKPTSSSRSSGSSAVRGSSSGSSSSSSRVRSSSGSRPSTASSGSVTRSRSSSGSSSAPAARSSSSRSRSSGSAPAARSSSSSRSRSSGSSSASSSSSSSRRKR